MKEIVFLRHAHTEAFHLSGDHARNLTERGRTQAKQIALHCSAVEGLKHVLVSDAVRTQQTAEIINNASQKKFKCVTEELLYLAPYTEIFAILSQLNEAYDKVMLIAHNPGLTDTAQYLLQPYEFSKLTEGVTPCTMVHMCADVAGWNALEPHSCTLKDYIIPKSS